MKKFEDIEKLLQFGVVTCALNDQLQKVGDQSCENQAGTYIPLE